MAWFNEEISSLLREYAELTQITGGDVFRARNYEKAARSVRGWADDIGQLDVKALRTIPGVGASIAAKIAEYRETGSIRALDELRAKIPSGVLELTRVPGLGPKRALQLNRDLGVQSVDDLAAAIKAGRLDGLAGFGTKSEERIAAGIEVYRQGRERVLLDVALRTANEMVDALTPISQRCAYAGSLRRWRETIGDIDILAAADDSAPLMAAFSAGHDVVASGPTKTTVRTASGLTADLRVLPLDAWGAALQYFTGSIAHNVAVRQIAVRANASPQRLDLPSDHIRAARDVGVRFAIDSDAHSVSDLSNMPYGVGTAQRGWLTPEDVINTWPLDRLCAFLRKDR